MSVAGMHHHTGFLVQDKHIIILIYDVKRDIFRKDFQTTPLIWHHKSHHITGTDYVVCLYDLFVDSYVFRFDSKLDTMARSIFHMRCKILVHTHRNLTGSNVEAIMLKHFLLFILICDLVPGIYRIEVLNRRIIKIKESFLCHLFLSFCCDFLSYRYLGLIQGKIQDHFVSHMYPYAVRRLRDLSEDYSIKTILIILDGVIKQKPAYIERMPLNCINCTYLSESIDIRYISGIVNGIQAHDKINHRFTFNMYSCFYFTIAMQLSQYIVGCHVLHIKKFTKDKTSCLKVGLRLSEGTSHQVRHSHLLGIYGIDCQGNASSFLDHAARRRSLPEHYAPSHSLDIGGIGDLHLHPSQGRRILSFRDRHI